MEIDKKNRKQLKAFFVKNAIPTEKNFADLIDAGLNQADDGVAKPEGNPLCIEAMGDTRKAINFYRDFADPNPAWSLALNPRSNIADPGSGNEGFAITDGAGKSRLFIDANTGHVGVGTSTPGHALVVQRSGNSTEVSLNDNLFLDGQGGTVRITNNAYVRDGWQIKDPAAKACTLEIRDTGMLEIYGTVTAGETDWRKMATFDAPSNKVVFPSGNVGIGTAAPEARLDITASQKTHGGWYEAIRFSKPEHSAITHPGGGLLFGLHGNRNFYFADILGGFKKYVLTLNANTGLMDVAGTVKAPKVQLGDKFLMSGVGDGHGNDGWLRLFNTAGSDYYGGLAAGRLWSKTGRLEGSDARMKKDIETIDGAAEKLRQLRGVAFRWQAPESGTARQFGLIAQEVEKIFPGLVEFGPDGMKSINYSGLIGPIIEAFKEQSAVVESLRRQVEELRRGRTD